MTSRSFAAFCLRNAECGAPSRFGFTVPRAVGKAVQRNRIKRLMREAVRREYSALAQDWTIVFNPRRGVLKTPLEDLCREVGRIFAQCVQS